MGNSLIYPSGRIYANSAFLGNMSGPTGGWLAGICADGGALWHGQPS